MSGHPPYPHEVKLEAVKLVTDQSLTPHKAARDLGVDPQTLRHWLRELAPASEQSSVADPRAAAELTRLRRAVAQLRQERAILKKAIRIFSRMPQ